MTFKLYVEGGGDASLDAECREGFRKLLERAGFAGRMPRLVACGDRGRAFDRFRTACECGETCYLLVDSEDLIAHGNQGSPWKHLKNLKGDGWEKPPNASDDQCHLMVVCMESWFLADKSALSSFFDAGFAESRLPKRAKIEEIPKNEVYDALGKATAACKRKGTYAKGAHSFKILAMLDPDKVRKASPWAERFFTKLDEVMIASGR